MNSGQISTFLSHIRTLSPVRGDQQATDHKLLEHFLENRDEEAFSVLLRRHGPMVLSVCRRGTRDWHQAEDAFQATFLVLAQKAHAIRQRDSVGSWLYGVARHVAAKAVRSATRQRNVEEARETMKEPDPLLDISLRDLQNIIHEELDKLPEKCRTALVHCYLEGKTHEQAATELGWSKGTVRGRVNRGRQLLRERLTRRGLAVSIGLVPAALTASHPTLTYAGPLAQETIRASLAFVGCRTASISPHVAALANSALKSLSLTKAKTALAVMLSIVVCGAAAWAHSAWTTMPASPASDEVPKATDKTTAKKPDAVVDQFGDALPPGALLRLGTRRLRHAEGVQSVAFSPDGKTVACGFSGAITLWDQAKGQALWRIQHEDRLATLKYSPDGRWLAAAGGKAVVMWDAATGRKLYSLDCPAVFEIPNGHSWLTSVPLEFSPDGKTAASVNKDHAILVWDTATGKEISKLLGHDQEITSLRFSRDGRSLISASGQRSADGSIRIWDLKTGKSKEPINLSSKLTSSSHVFAISPDGSMVAVEALEQVREEAGAITRVFMEYRIHLLETATGKERRRLKGKGEVIVTACFSPDGAKLASATRDNQVTVWEVDSGKALHQFQQAPGGGAGGTYALAFSPDGQVLASSSEGTAVHLWDLTTGRELLAQPAHAGAINVVAFAPDGRTIASASGDHSIRLWDARTGKGIANLRGHTAGIDALAFAPDGKTLASAAGDESARLWNLSSSQEIVKITLPNRQLSTGRYVSVRPLALTFSVDGKSLLAGSNDSRFHQWDAASGKETKSWPWVLGGSATPTTNAEGALFTSPTIRFSPNGKTAAITSGEELHLVDVASGRAYAKLNRKISQESMAFAEDSRTLVSAGWVKTVKVWEVATGQLIWQTSVPEPANSVAFAPDGRHVAVGCGWKNASIHVFDIATRKEAIVFKGIGAYIGTLYFAPDSLALVSGHRDTTALVWDLSSIQASKTSKPRSLDVAALEKLWTDLKSDDAAQAHAALWSLVSTPDSAVRFVKSRLSPVPKVTEARLRQLILDLDADAFDKREAATQELLQIGRDADPALRQILKETTSTETRRRIESLLENQGRSLPSPDLALRLRAIQALELIHTEEAIAILKDLSQGAPAAVGTQEAISAIERVKTVAGKNQ